MLVCKNQEIRERHPSLLAVDSAANHHFSTKVFGSRLEKICFGRVSGVVSSHDTTIKIRDGNCTSFMIWDCGAKLLIYKPSMETRARFDGPFAVNSSNCS